MKSGQRSTSFRLHNILQKCWQLFSVLNSEAYSHKAVLVTTHSWPISEMFLFPLDIGSKLRSVMTPGGFVFEVMYSYLFTPLERLCLVIHLIHHSKRVSRCLSLCVGHMDTVCVCICVCEMKPCGDTSSYLSPASPSYDCCLLRSLKVTHQSVICL